MTPAKIHHNSQQWPATRKSTSARRVYGKRPATSVYRFSHRWTSPRG